MIDRYRPNMKSPAILARIEQAKQELLSAKLKLWVLMYMTEDVKQNAHR